MDTKELAIFGAKIRLEQAMKDVKELKDYLKSFKRVYKARVKHKMSAQARKNIAEGIRKAKKSKKASSVRKWTTERKAKFIATMKAKRNAKMIAEQEQITQKQETNNG